jgi:protein phosphatase
MHLTTESYGISDIGLVRKNNEDVWTSQELPYPFFVLADGMGGHKAGEIAAKVAVDELCKKLKELLSDVEESLSPEEISLGLQAAILSANEHVFKLSVEQPECAGMGTTLSCFLIYQDTLLFGHVGDSRIYRFRKGTLKQISHDHSLRQELLLKGSLDITQAASYPYKNVITRAIGTHATVEPDIGILTIMPGDIYFLCSDGLSDTTSEGEIRSLIAKAETIKEASDSLIATAKAHGGHDNITVVMVEIN